jgi:long-subunit acyl-CoA synthetase (AMP-forming)
LYRGLQDKFAVPIIEAFGMTEALSHCFTNPLYGEQRMGTVGLPSGIEARIDQGHLLIKGHSVHAPGWFDTGDFAEQDQQGYYKILGRHRDQINVKGYKFNPLSLEQQLYDMIPEITEISIFGTNTIKCLYVGEASVKKILDAVNLKIIDVSFNNINGGSFALTVAKKNSKYLENKKIYKILRDEKNKKINTSYIYMQFYKRINKEKNKMISFFKKIKLERKLVIGYGASTKGNVLLQYCNISNKNIKYICDVNEDKNGCYTPGTKIKIISEKKAKQLKPDYFFVLPWHFKNFILDKEKKIIRSGIKFIFPLPKFKVI